MTRHLRLGRLAVVLLLMVGCSTNIPEDASGKDIYLQLCARCHADGLEGRLGPPLGQGSAAASRSDEFLVFTIERGRGRMPSFGSTLDDVQVDLLVGYIREVQGE